MATSKTAKTAKPAQAETPAVAPKPDKAPKAPKAPKAAKAAKVAAPSKAAAPAKAVASAKAAKPAAPAKAATPAKAAKATKAARPAASAVTPKVEGALERKLASQPPRARNSPIRVFQMYSESWQRELSDPAFYPLDVSRLDPKALELSVWTQLGANPATQGAQLWGAVSWRFAERTGMSGADWVRQIEAQPGADVYFSSTDGAHEAVFHNPWLQAGTQHPRFLEVAAAFFEATGLPAHELNAITPSALSASGGMLVARPAFWDAYLPWLRTLMAQADRKMPAALRDLMHAPLASPDGAGTSPSSCLAVIVDRLLPLFLRTQGKSFKHARIMLPERERELNVHQKLLREMKDVAHRTQSAWLAACWVNYRNLYLGQTQGKPWVQKHLRAITPAEIRFG